METKRLFIAIDISGEVRTLIDEHIEGLKKLNNKSVRWERCEKIHLTLKFLGGTDPVNIPAVESLLSETASTHRRFDLALQGTGVFPNLRKARVLWIGLNESESLSQLHADIETRLESIGVPKEDRRFSPHLTIARIKDTRQAKPVIEQHLASEFGPVKFPANEIALYESKLAPSGSVYSILGRYHLLSDSKTDSR